MLKQPRVYLALLCGIICANLCWHHFYFEPVLQSNITAHLNISTEPTYNFKDVSHLLATSCPINAECTKLTLQSCIQAEPQNAEPVFVDYSQAWRATLYNFFNEMQPSFIGNINPELVLTEVHEVKQSHSYDANALISMWIRIIAIAILTIWARSVGPRFRIDQLNDLTWKDLLPLVVGILFCSIASLF